MAPLIAAGPLMPLRRTSLLRATSRSRMYTISHGTWQLEPGPALALTPSAALSGFRLCTFAGKLPALASVHFSGAPGDPRLPHNYAPARAGPLMACQSQWHCGSGAACPGPPSQRPRAARGVTGAAAPDAGPARPRYANRTWIGLPQCVPRASVRARRRPLRPYAALALWATAGASVPVDSQSLP
jgi:hypothetical protein